MASAYKVYWEAYGGFSALIKSNYLYASVLFVLVAPKAWMLKDDNGRYAWTETALSITPSMLGFSLGAMAILLAIGASTFLNVSQKGGNDSLYMKAIAAFFHFMLVQIISILSAIFVGSWNFVLVSLFGYFIFVYAIFCGLAAAAALVDLAEVKIMADRYDAGEDID